MLAGQDVGVGQAVVIALVGIVVVMFELGMLAVFVSLLSRGVRAVESRFKKKQPQPTVSAPVTQSNEGLSVGELKLTNVDEPTAATIMAIVSHNSGIALNRLKFKSIRLIEDAEEETK